MSPSPSKPWWRRWFGTRSERSAARFLKSLGYRILVRNFSCPMGELDLVALDGTTLVFVEVRSTESDELERPAASVDLKKQERLTKLAVYFLKQKRLLGRAARFDVVTVSWPEGAKEPLLEHFRNAFEAIGTFDFFR